MKSLANEARKAHLTAKYETPKKNPTAAKAYEQEVSHLKYQLNEAKKNAPIERRAQALAQSVVELERQNSGGQMSKGEYSKRLDRELKRSREILGAKRYQMDISPKEWEAIQSGAVPKTTQEEIFKYADAAILREYAMPKEKKGLDKSYISLAKSMAKRGYTLQEIADRFDVSPSTISNIIVE